MNGVCMVHYSNSYDMLFEGALEEKERRRRGRKKTFYINDP
jgi:hypothetical protein